MWVFELFWHILNKILFKFQSLRTNIKRVDIMYDRWAFTNYASLEPSITSVRVIRNKKYKHDYPPEKISFSCKLKSLEYFHYQQNGSNLKIKINFPHFFTNLRMTKNTYITLATLFHIFWLICAYKPELCCSYHFQ